MFSFQSVRFWSWNLLRIQTHNICPSETTISSSSELLSSCSVAPNCWFLVLVLEKLLLRLSLLVATSAPSHPPEAAWAFIFSQATKSINSSVLGVSGRSSAHHLTTAALYHLNRSRLIAEEPHWRPPELQANQCHTQTELELGPGPLCYPRNRSRPVLQRCQCSLSLF